jgi:hypothetical protein
MRVQVDGVVRAHAYTVMSARPVEVNGRGQVLLLQVREGQRGLCGRVACVRC